MRTKIRAKKVVAWLFTLAVLVGLVAVLSLDVFATETATETAVVKWGVDANSLTNEGTFEEAVTATNTEGVNYVQLQGDVTLGDDIVGLGGNMAITLDLAGHSLIINNYFHVPSQTSLTVTDSSLEGSGKIITTEGRSFAWVDGTAELILDKVILSTNCAVYANLLTVKQDVVIEKTFEIVYFGGNWRYDLSDVTDLLKISIYFGAETIFEGEELILPEGKMLYHNGTPTESIVGGETYRFGDVPESKISYLFSAGEGTGTMDPVTAYGEILLPECDFTAPEGKRFVGWLANGTVYQAGDCFSASENTTLTAQWMDTAGSIIVNVSDSYADGWNGAAIKVYRDGAHLETITLDAGGSKTFVLDYSDDAWYDFYWSAGSYDSECSFEIFLEGESVYVCENASAFSHNECFYTIESDVPVSIANASISIGKDLSITYYVNIFDEALLESLAQIKLHVTFNGATYVLSAGAADEDGQYPFKFRGIAPQQMGDNIKAELKLGDEVLVSKDSYSVKENAQALLTSYKDSSNEEDLAMIQLVTDLLYYGAAAQAYTDYNSASPVTEGVSDLGTPSAHVPSVTDLTRTASVSDTVYFKSAGVYFDHVNKLYVKLSTDASVSLTVKKNGVTLGNYIEFVTVDGSVTFLTDAIYATDFDDVYTFELYEGETLVQTLTYSVKSYVYAMQQDANMSVLACALYRYGMSAKGYVAYFDSLINTRSELQAALNAGGTVKLESNINLGDGYVSMPSNSGTLDLNGYEIISNSDFYALYVVGNWTVTDSSEGGTGKVTSASYAIFNAGSVIIQGGTFWGRYDGVYSANDQITVTGGTFNNDPTIYLNSTVYKAVQNSDGTYTVQKKSSTDVDEPEDTAIDTEEELQAALNAGGTIVLGGNISMDFLSISSGGGNVTLDLNGYTLTLANGIVNSATLTIKDSKGGGVIVGTDAFLIKNVGTLTINGGTLTSSSHPVIYQQSGTITINGGTFTSTADCAIFLKSGSLKVVGSEASFNGLMGDSVYWASGDASIDLSEFTGESFQLQPAEADMPLSNLILPTGWKLYDTNGEEIVATVKWGSMIAKAEITDGDTENP